MISANQLFNPGKRILITHSHTLYAKVSIPLTLLLLENGHDVSYKVNRRTVAGKSFGFSKQYIKRNPTNVMITNPQSLDYVSGIINYRQEWRKTKSSVSYKNQDNPKQFDAIISTTKDIPYLESVTKEYRIPVFAVGYHHLPYVLKISQKPKPVDVPADENSVFLSDNRFSEYHSFPQIIGGHKYCHVGFLYLDKLWVYLNSSEYHINKDKTVLVFHPGGFRGVFSEKGDSKAVCYASQKESFEKIFLPLLEAGFHPVIKVHPLRAVYHDYEDVAEIISDFEVSHGLKEGDIRILQPDEWYWDYAFKSSFILTFGSSSIYELWSAGLVNVFVCNFFGKERSGKFEFFENISIDSYDSYLNFVKSGSYFIDDSVPLTREVYQQYADLFTGKSTQTAYNFIMENL